MATIVGVFNVAILLYEYDSRCRLPSFSDEIFVREQRAQVRRAHRVSPISTLK